MSIADEIRELEELRDAGSLSEHEFQQAKQNALDGGGSKGVLSSGPGVICGIPEKTWCMLMHLSQLAVFAGGVGIVAPIVMWVISKDESDLARRHGARMMNWMISSFIYTIIGALLCLVLVGIPLLIALVVLTIAFPIMAAMKANEGQIWSYPLTIRFLEEN